MTEPQAPKHTALLPCPFCGKSDAKLRHSFADGMSWVSCQPCGLETPTETGVSDQQAVEYWNRRAPVSAIEPDPSSSAQEVRAALEPFAAIVDAPHFQYVHDEQRLFLETKAEVVISEGLRGSDFRRARKALASAPPVRSTPEASDA